MSQIPPPPPGMAPQQPANPSPQTGIYQPVTSQPHPYAPLQPPATPPYCDYNRGKGYGIAALVLGIITILFLFIPPVGVIGILTGIIGIILGRRGMTLSPPGMGGMATAGFVCSLVGLCILLLGLLIVGGLIGMIAGMAR